MGLHWYKYALFQIKFFAIKIMKMKSIYFNGFFFVSLLQLDEANVFNFGHLHLFDARHPRTSRILFNFVEAIVCRRSIICSLKNQFRVKHTGLFVMVQSLSFVRTICVYRLKFDDNRLRPVCYFFATNNSTDVPVISFGGVHFGFLKLEVFHGTL